MPYMCHGRVPDENHTVVPQLSIFSWPCKAHGARGWMFGVPSKRASLPATCTGAQLKDLIGGVGAILIGGVGAIILEGVHCKLRMHASCIRVQGAAELEAQRPGGRSRDGENRHYEATNLVRLRRAVPAHGSFHGMVS